MEGAWRTDRQCTVQAEAVVWLVQVAEVAEVVEVATSEVALRAAEAMGKVVVKEASQGVG